MCFFTQIIDASRLCIYFSPIKVQAFYTLSTNVTNNFNVRLIISIHLFIMSAVIAVCVILNFNI